MTGHADLRADGVRDLIRRELQRARLVSRTEEAIAIEEAMANRIASALVRLEAAERELDAFKAMLAQDEQGGLGRVYPAHITEWAKVIRQEQGYNSALTAWLAEVGCRWAALARSAIPAPTGEEGAG